MTWPQIVILLLTVLGFIAATVSIVRDRKASSGETTFRLFFHACWYAGYALVLHAGGFW